MLSGRPPFHSSTDAETMSLISSTEVIFKQGPVWNNISQEAKDLLTRMLKKEPKERPTAEEVLSNKWLVSYTRSTINDCQISPDVLKNLEMFHVISNQAKNKLQKSIFSFISGQVMTSIEKQKLTDMFISLDKNGDGTLSREEIEDGYDALGIPAPISLKDLLKKLDGDGNGSINYNDFLTASQDWSKVSYQKELEGVFRLYDSAGDGIVAVEELKKAIPGIQDSEWDEFLSEADTNCDGFLSFEELKNYLTKRQ
jgi:calcium-dependent protein kinase